MVLINKCKILYSGILYLVLTLTPAIGFSKITNNTNLVLMIKPEVGEKSIYLLGNSTYFGLHDGFSFVCGGVLLVYKSIDNIDVVVNKSCKVEFSSESNYFYEILQMIKGGFLHEPPDIYWQGLFEFDGRAVF